MANPSFLSPAVQYSPKRNMVPAGHVFLQGHAYDACTKQKGGRNEEGLG